MAFKVGQSIRVENYRSEVLYHGYVEKIQGARITVKLPAADTRSFEFNLADRRVIVDFDNAFISANW